MSSTNLPKIALIPAFGEAAFLCGCRCGLDAADRQAVRERLGRLQEKLQAAVTLMEDGIRLRIDLGCADDAAQDGASAMALVGDILSYLSTVRADLDAAEP